MASEPWKQFNQRKRDVLQYVWALPVTWKRDAWVSAEATCLLVNLSDSFTFVTALGETTNEEAVPSCILFREKRKEPLRVYAIQSANYTRPAHTSWFATYFEQFSILCRYVCDARDFSLSKGAARDWGASGRKLRLVLSWQDVHLISNRGLHEKTDVLVMRYSLNPDSRNAGIKRATSRIPRSQFYAENISPGGTSVRNAAEAYAAQKARAIAENELDVAEETIDAILAQLRALTMIHCVGDTRAAILRDLRRFDYDNRVDKVHYEVERLRKSLESSALAGGVDRDCLRESLTGFTSAFSDLSKAVHLALRSKEVLEPLVIEARNLSSSGAKFAQEVQRIVQKWRGARAARSAAPCDGRNVHMDGTSLADRDDCHSVSPSTALHRGNERVNSAARVCNAAISESSEMSSVWKGAVSVTEAAVLAVELRDVQEDARRILRECVILENRVSEVIQNVFQVAKQNLQSIPVSEASQNMFTPGHFGLAEALIELKRTAGRSGVNKEVLGIVVVEIDKVAHAATVRTTHAVAVWRQNIEKVEREIKTVSGDTDRRTREELGACPGERCGRCRETENRNSCEK